jgi:FixJ family two-component response regulator
VSSQLVAVVDDDASVRRALTRLLQSADLRVLSYASATEFLESGTSSAPDCLILDIHLGGMSGLELLSRLRELGNNLPVLIITAHDDAQTRESAARGGCAAYLRKPLDARVLLEEVATAMKRAA